MKLKLILLSTVIAMCCGVVNAERIKDITDVQGVRGNPLMGIGLVVGLSNTGDTSLPSRQMLTNILRDSEIVLATNDLKGQNIAFVTVTAYLGPFKRKGATIDVDVSSIGDAQSLQGGMLLATPLKGLDGEVYAVAQGGISLAGFGASGKQASVKKNHLTVGRIASGAIVEREEVSSLYETVAGQRYVTLNLRNEDFSTAENIGESISGVFPGCTQVVDAGMIRVLVPESIPESGIVAFINNMTMLEAKVDMPAIVVINEKTGTVVVGEKVAISAIAISHGGLVVKIKETENVSQPNGMFSDAGTTERVPETMISVEDKKSHLVALPRVVTISDLAKTLNAVGAAPTDLVAIFNALKQAGALQAKIVNM